MKNSTKKFGLLIVDDEKDIRGMYRKALSEHYKLKDLWDSIGECEEGESALKYIKGYLGKNLYHLIVVSDAFMPPNCDGNKPLPDKLFGGLWLIDHVNKNKELKEDVSLVLITYFDEQIKPYLMGGKVQFECKRDEHYFYVSKPYIESTYKGEKTKGIDQGQKEATKELSKLDPETTEKLFKETFHAIWKAIDSKREAVGELSLLKEDITLSTLPTPIIGNSQKMQEVYDFIKRVSPTDSTVLITGESGTGKELVAKNLHYLNDKRKDKAFIQVNSAGIPTELFESELFGCKKGAFSGAVDREGKFEAANGGTIFFDEIGDMSQATQVKMLRVLQEKSFEPLGSNNSIPVDVRVVAATNKNLVQEINKKGFREGLHYRLNVIPIHLPPLRERREDIPLLVEYFLNKLYSEGL